MQVLAGRGEKMVVFMMNLVIHVKCFYRMTETMTPIEEAVLQKEDEIYL